MALTPNDLTPVAWFLKPLPPDHPVLQFLLVFGGGIGLGLLGLWLAIKLGLAMSVHYEHWRKTMEQKRAKEREAKQRARFFEQVKLFWAGLPAHWEKRAKEMHNGDGTSNSDQTTKLHNELDKETHQTGAETSQKANPPAIQEPDGDTVKPDIGAEHCETTEAHEKHRATRPDQTKERRRVKTS